MLNENFYILFFKEIVKLKLLLSQAYVRLV
jgi:hypothetical protein